MSILTFSKRNLRQSASKLRISGQFKVYQENYQKHTADICKLRVLYRCPSVIKTPARRPGLNPFEHVLLGSVVPARISSQSRRHCWRSPLPHVSALIQRDFGCVFGIQQTKQLPHVAKLIWCGSWGCNLGQSLSSHGPHVFYRRKIWRVRRPGKQLNLVIDEEPLDIACHVWSRIILLKYGCGQALKARKDNWLQHGNVALAV
ncbi:uncharacterized protein TNCV_3829421 [Trichonephila clavipes]|nr:uncharacterized protein TNCV_3829421 [Trichonephila clavipes]